MGNQVQRVSRGTKSEIHYYQQAENLFFENYAYSEWNELPNKNPLSNPLILEQILSLLDLKELLQCRMVSCLWKNLVHRFLVQKAKEICFFPSYTSSEMKMFFGTRNCSRSKLKKFLSVMEHAEHVPVTRYLLQDVIPRDPLIIRFLRICGASVKSLQIGFADDNYWEEFLNHTPNLEEINIFAMEKPRYTLLSYLNQPNLHLENLKSVTFTTRSVPFLRNILAVAKNLDTILIHVGPKYGDNTLKLNIKIGSDSINREVLVSEKPEIKSFNANLLGTLLNSAPNLKSLNVDMKYKTNFSILKTLMTEQSLRKSLRNFVVNGSHRTCVGKIELFHEDLSELYSAGWELQCVKWTSFVLQSSSLPHFTKFLESQRYSLKKLALPCLDLPSISAGSSEGNELDHNHDNNNNNNYNNNYNINQSEIVIPRMEKLEELILQCLVPPKISSWAYNFPMLKCLEVKKLYFSLTELEQLFPESNLTSPCTTLKELVIDFKMFSPEYFRRIFTIFPEVEGLCLHEPTAEVVKTLWELWPNLKKLHLGINTNNDEYNEAIVGLEIVSKETEMSILNSGLIKESDAVDDGNERKHLDSTLLYSIRNLKNLEELYIHGPITVSTLLQILELKSLKCLEITSPHKTQIYEHVVSDGFSHIENITFRTVCSNYIKLEYKKDKCNK